MEDTRRRWQEQHDARAAKFIEDKMLVSNSKQNHQCVVPDNISTSAFFFWFEPPPPSLPEIPVELCTLL